MHLQVIVLNFNGQCLVFNRRSVIWA